MTLGFHLFSDSDGVMADFEGGFKAQFGADFYSLAPGKAWAMIYRNPDFYFNLPLMPGAHEYWEVIKGHEPTVLTGCPTAGFNAAADAKRRWWAKHFNYTNVITCFSRDKPKHMKNPGDLLIDDHEKNLVKWKDAGGRVLLFQHAQQAMDDIVNQRWQ